MRTFRNIILPAMILAVLLMLLVGCVYVPWFERPVDKSSRDFRTMVGRPGSGSQIQVGRITRARIESLLGRPLYISQDGSATGYRFDVNRDYWVFPLCFATEPGSQKVYVIRFDFDANRILRRYDVASDTQLLSWIAYTSPWDFHTDKILQQLNVAGPKLLPVPGLIELQDQTLIASPPSSNKGHP